MERRSTLTKGVVRPIQGLASARTCTGNASRQVLGVPSIRVGDRALVCGGKGRLRDGMVTGGRSTLTKGVVCPIRYLTSARTCAGNASRQVPGIASVYVGAWMRFCERKERLSDGECV